ncbi:STAS domain-containing protein [Actinomadura hibisca]|uniref:STAS domain-containing protein n=1 Tax=Actinomadura hibisca TaxID=68565 RepID=UPI000834B0FB|nr:STAS domain-containing protein [Actinomadura hibisca]
MNDRPPLTVTVAFERECVVLRLAGALDHRETPRLRRWANRIAGLSGPVRLVVDLTGLDDCDAVGTAAVRAMVVTVIEAGGYIVVAGVPPRLREMFGADSLLTAEAAVELLSSQAVPRRD